MTSNFKIQKVNLLFIIAVLTSTLSFSQTDSEKWKFQIALGINNPLESPENVGYWSKYVNFPTVNLGLEHMFSEAIGAKLDIGFNRSSNSNSSPEFKLNYTRVNVQMVYNFRSSLHFLPNRVAIVAHAGPGISFTQPLGNFSKNKYTFLNALGGLEIHYGLSRNLSIYGDLGYVYSFAGKNKYDVALDGFSFNNDLMYAAFGVSISLNGCKYCN